MRAEEGVSYLALRKRNQVFHKGEAAADLGLEEQQVELRLHEILQDVNQLRVQILKKLSICSDNLARCHKRTSKCRWQYHLFVEAGAECSVAELLESFIETNGQSAAQQMHAVAFLRWVIHWRLHFLNNLRIANIPRLRLRV